jgi:RNA polymerase sigma-70 factor (ECF subfamily)
MRKGADRRRSPESGFGRAFNRVETSGVSRGTWAGMGDAELVRRVRQGDGEAFGLLVSRYRRAAYAVALSVTGRHEDAEDAAQESFVVALERLDDCREPERFAGWFMTIVRNRSRNLIRRESLRDTEKVPESAPAGGALPDRVAEAAQLRERLQEALAELPVVQREIVLLHDLEGWKHREIAERLSLPSGTVRSHLHFARKALRKALEVTLGRDRQE